MSISNSMTIQTFLTVAPFIPKNISVLIRGAHGIGKSKIVRKLAAIIAAREKFENFEVIDRRLSQLTEGDLVGLPSVEGGVTRFNPPDWFNRACSKPVCLFLDELNRATHELMQAAFQVVLDRELNGHKLHPDTRVFVAVNASSEYTINEMDPALLDRFWVVDLLPDTQDWLIWAKDKDDGNVNGLLVDFITANEKWLDPPKTAETGGVYATRRSWERVDLALKNAKVEEDPKSPLFYHLSMGFVGVEAAIAFCDFAKTYDAQVSGKDVIATYDDVREKVKRMTNERLNALIEKVATYTDKHCTSLDEMQGNNLKNFMTDLPGELRISCWSKLSKSGLNKLDLVKSVHKYCASLILDVFGVPMGEAGVGVTPNIPGLVVPKENEKKSKTVSTAIDKKL